MRADIHQQCRNKWASVLGMLGVQDSFLRNRQGPCPLCGGKDRYRFDDKEGRGTWICNNCGAGNGMDLAIAFTGMNFAECAQAIRERLGEATERKPKREIDPDQARRACQQLWSGAVSILDDDAARYLRSRGLLGPYSNELRFHPSAEVTGHPSRRTLPALIARVSDHAGCGVSIHRTYLENGAKAKWLPLGETVPANARRLMAGELPVDAAIRLSAHDGVLGVAEGIETALAVTRDFGIPCWSLINSTHMERWLVPQGLRELHVFGDNDLKFGGQAAAYRLCHRAACMPNGPKVFDRIPETPGTDWADTSAAMETA